MKWVCQDCFDLLPHAEQVKAASVTSLVVRCCSICPWATKRVVWVSALLAERIQTLRKRPAAEPCERHRVAQCVPCHPVTP
ncbi:MAG TPA: hypothetical protein VH062_02290 [Polyangiaceae bacterium]|nr:hypothetical protein [Polyangiaceae bacterium]